MVYLCFQNCCVYVWQWAMMQKSSNFVHNVLGQTNFFYDLASLWVYVYLWVCMFVCLIEDLRSSTSLWYLFDVSNIFFYLFEEFLLKCCSISVVVFVFCFSLLFLVRILYEKRNWNYRTHITYFILFFYLLHLNRILSIWNFFKG